MANVLFDRFSVKDIIIKGIELPRIGDEVFLDGKSYKAILMKHFPEGGKGVEVYKKITSPFVRVSLQPL
jgi:hypothetical protein